MTLTELRYILAVAREGHFGRAAASCFVSQPTLSMGIKRLEEELDMRLFERGTSRVRVTAKGRPIIEQAQRVIEEAERIGTIARHGQDPMQGPLRIGAIFTIAPYLLPKLIPLLHQSAPQMPLLIQEDFTAQLREKLKHGELDAIIIALPFDEVGVETLPLYTEAFRVLLPQDHPWAERDCIDSGQLSQLELLLLGPGHCFRDQILQVCPECNRSSSSNIELQRTLEGGSLETIRLMVSSGIGATVLPCTALAERQDANTQVLPFSEPAPRRQVALAWRRSFHRASAIDAVAEAIRACPLPCIQRLNEDQTADQPSLSRKAK
ncbi:MAG: LysR substrate-binding domain-containing protein [Gammaproteobacteria bacterium SHHR-1]|uniref:hydrogen peroxide-inducible genes activator n=1 Tax=Magnetovirga frankeli TaxID=947516 RepID=UPI001293B5AC|nr:LysR family transcriptional regulator [gamma proteobacterium SS-5]